MKIFSGIVGTLIILLALAFALANRQTATISLWPLGFDVQAPLCLLTLGPLLGGILLGATITWFNMIPHRRRTRQLRKELTHLHKKMSDLHQTVMPPDNRNDDFLLESPKVKRRMWQPRP